MASRRRRRRGGSAARRAAWFLSESEAGVSFDAEGAFMFTFSEAFEGVFVTFDAPVTQELFDVFEFVGEVRVVVEPPVTGRQLALKLGDARFGRLAAKPDVLGGGLAELVPLLLGPFDRPGCFS